MIIRSWYWCKGHIMLCMRDYMINDMYGFITWVRWWNDVYYMYMKNIYMGYTVNRINGMINEMLMNTDKWWWVYVYGYRWVYKMYMLSMWFCMWYVLICICHVKAWFYICVYVNMYGHVIDGYYYKSKTTMMDCFIWVC